MPKPGEVFHRRNNDGAYEPGNIQFLTKKEHNRIQVHERQYKKLPSYLSTYIGLPLGKTPSDIPVMELA
jgi:hypothetical protein